MPSDEEDGQLWDLKRLPIEAEQFSVSVVRVEPPKIAVLTFKTKDGKFIDLFIGDEMATALADNLDQFVAITPDDPRAKG